MSSTGASSSFASSSASNAQQAVPSVAQAAAALAGPQSRAHQALLEEQPVPRDVILMDKILRSMGITQYEPRVIEQLLELVHRYVSDIFIDSQVYMQHAQRQELDIDDVQLAIQSRINSQFTEPPPVEFLLETANAKNQQGFLLPEKPRVLLPPEQFCITSRNFQLSAQPGQHDILPLESTPAENGAAAKKRKM